MLKFAAKSQIVSLDRNQDQNLTIQNPADLWSGISAHKNSTRVVWEGQGCRRSSVGGAEVFAFWFAAWLFKILVQQYNLDATLNTTLISVKDTDLCNQMGMKGLILDLVSQKLKNSSPAPPNES